MIDSGNAFGEQGIDFVCIVFVVVMRIAEGQQSTVMMYVPVGLLRFSFEIHSSFEDNWCLQLSQELFFLCLCT